MAAPTDTHHVRGGPPAAERGIADLFAEVVKEFSNLLHKEMQLARTELSEKVTLVALSVGLIVAGAVLVMAALLLLLQAGVAALVASGLSVAVATLVVAGATLIVGLGILWFGVTRLQAKNLAPAKTLAQLQQDAGGRQIWGQPAMSDASRDLEHEAEASRRVSPGSWTSCAFASRPGRWSGDWCATPTGMVPGSQFLRTLREQVRSNPIACMLIAAGITWMMVSDLQKNRRAVRASELRALAPRRSPARRSTAKRTRARRSAAKTPRPRRRTKPRKRTARRA